MPKVCVTLATAAVIEVHGEVQVTSKSLVSRLVIGSLKVSFQTKTTDAVFSLAGFERNCEVKVGATVSTVIFEMTVAWLSRPPRLARAVMS